MKRSAMLAMSVSCLAIAARAQQVAAVEPQAQPAGLAWSDYDADGKLDALAILPSGRVVLLRNQGAGMFADQSAATGLANARGASFATWQDVDGDGLADLFLGGAGDTPRLWRNAGGTFEPCDCGIAHDALDLDALWIDIDDDQLPDLLAITDAGELVYRNLGGSQFERVELPLPASASVVAVDSEQLEDADQTTLQRRERSRARLHQRLANNAASGPNAGAFTSTSTTATSPASGGPLPLIQCRPGIMDIATNACIDASTTPTLGTLYPLSANLFVNASGNVGIGTTSPGNKLQVIDSGTTVAAIWGSNAGGTWVDFKNSSAGGRSWALLSTGSANGEGAGKLAFHDHTANATRMLIDTAGNLGIGTTAPGTKLDVAGSVRSTAQFVSSVATGTAPLSVLSTTKVTNLNADTLDGIDSTALSQLGNSIESGEITDGTLQMADIGQNGASSGAVIKWNGTAWVPGSDNSSQWSTNGSTVFYSGGSVGVGTSTPAAALHVASNDGLLAGGTFGSGALPVSGAGTRMVWYPRKAAFRAGRASSNQWDDADTGIYSVAFGYATHASGEASIALGDSTNASGISSTALGDFTSASGDYSTALGANTEATGNCSTALGYDTSAGGLGSTALGWSASASGVVSSAIGNLAYAGGDFSIALGDGVQAGSRNVTALGRWNVGGGNPTTWNATDPLFEIGNGTSYVARTNALTVLKNGSVGIGTTAPDSLLHVYMGSAGAVTANANSVLTCERNGNAYVSVLSPDANERGVIFGEPSNNVAGGIFYNSGGAQDGFDFRTNGNTTRMVIDSSGNVGIGTMSPGDKLEVVGGMKVDAWDQNTGTTANALRFGGGGSGEAIFSKRSAGGNQYGLDLMTNSASRLAITLGGNVGIGTTAPGAMLEVNGSAAKPGGGSWAVSSDARLKHNVRTLDHALDTLLALRGVTFEYNDPAAIHELPGERMGFIAQEVEKVVPDWVEQGPNGYKRMTIRGFEALAVESMRELADQNAQLKRENEDLRERVSQLELLASDVAALKAELAKVASVR